MAMEMEKGQLRKVSDGFSRQSILSAIWSFRFLFLYIEDSPPKGFYPMQ